MVDHGYLVSCVQGENEVVRMVEVILQSLPILFQLRCHPVLVALGLLERLQRCVDIAGQL